MFLDVPLIPFVRKDGAPPPSLASPILGPSGSPTLLPPDKKDSTPDASTRSIEIQFPNGDSYIGESATIGGTDRLHGYGT